MFRLKLPFSCFHCVSNIRMDCGGGVALQTVKEDYKSKGRAVTFRYIREGVRKESRIVVASR